ncbi:hypothetical protein Q7P37_008925 [Cladosporium fusiforme]
MISFLELPRELRDWVYDECFIATRAISLQNLNSSPRTPTSQRLGLVPNLLASCRQIYEEGITKLYGENLYFVDLVSSWRFSPSLQWYSYTGMLAEQFDICVACQRNEPHSSMPGTTPGLDPWNPNIVRIRRLQVSLQQYTYSQWKYRQPSIFPRMPPGCLHVIQYALPPQVRIRLMVVRILDRSLLSIEDSKYLSRWHAVSLRYNNRDVEQWKLEGNEDLSRLVEGVLRFARQTADTIVVSKPGRSPCVLIKTTFTPKFISDLLRTRLYFQRKALKTTSGRLDRNSSGAFHRLRERTSTIAKISGSKVVCLDGEDIAFMSI